MEAEDEEEEEALDGGLFQSKSIAVINSLFSPGPIHFAPLPSLLNQNHSQIVKQF